MNEQMTVNDKKNKFAKVHRIVQKVFKYGIVIALVAFIILVLTHQGKFAETVGFTRGRTTLGKEIKLYDGDKIEQEFKAPATSIYKLDFLIDRNRASARDGSIDLKIVDKNGKVVFHITPTLAEVDGGEGNKGTMKRDMATEDRKYYRIQVNTPLEKGEQYTYVIEGKGIDKKRPLVFYTSKKMGDMFKKVQVNGKAQDVHLRARIWAPRIDMQAVILTVLIALVLIGVILVPFKLPEKWNKICSWTLCAVTPYVAFYMVEKVFYNPIMQMNSWAYWMNIVWYYIIFAILLLIFNRIKYALLVGNVFFYGAAIANYFVLSFRGTPITPADIYAAGTAMDVADHYVLTYDKPAIVATIVLLGLCVAACKLETFKVFKLRWRLVTVAFIAILTVGQGFLTTRTEFLEKKEVYISFWNQKGTYKRNGYLLAFLMNVQYTIVPEPEGYSLQKVNNMAKDYKIGTGENTSLKQKPNVVVVMNETFSDLNVVNSIKTNKEVMPYINSMQEDTIKGHMLVSVFGGGTSNSEYEFLTGNSVSTLPLNGNAYTQFVKHDVPNLTTELKEQGYDTVAFHPYKAHGWNRDTVYPYLGFDTFLDETSMDPNGEKLRGWYSDSEDYKKIMEVFDKKKDGDPMFLFNVTIQNHGGYLSPDKNFNEEIKIQDEKATTTANRYLSLIHESDKAFKELIDYFKKKDEPTIVVMFGDHQPKLEDSFYEMLYGKSIENLGLADLQKKFTVPFLIWANYDIKEQDNVNLMSNNYLSSLMLQQTNLKMSRYNEFLLKLHQSIPALNANGYVGKDGKNYSFDTKNKYTKLIQDYQYLQYNNLMGNEDASKAWFSVKE